MIKANLSQGIINFFVAKMKSNIAFNSDLFSSKFKELL